MYSGTTFNKKSGRMLGVHQRINRAARKKIEPRVKKDFFPRLKNINHFEGKNGPDGIKRKNPGVDEPWHFIDPAQPKTAGLLMDISNHQFNLRQALTTKDEQRAGFEAAWLAHAVIDGLTPAHHHGLEKQLEQLRGEALQTRTSIRKKLVISGKNPRQRLRNNWQFWGARGLMTSHVLFELGVASAMTPTGFKDIALTASIIDQANVNGFEAYFLSALRQVAAFNMYETFLKKGWTTGLARQTRQQLMPLITQSVALAWLTALEAKQ